MLVRWISVAGATALFCLSFTPASAQYAPRNFDHGTVTEVLQYEVKPGQLNAFMQDLAADFRPAMEQGKARGAILNYGVDQPVDPRPGEPNLSVVIVFKNMAALDRPLDDSDKSAVAHYGSLEKARDALMKRETEATYKGSLLLRSLEFTK
jgi:hypothetical protein